MSRVLNTEYGGLLSYHEVGFAVSSNGFDNAVFCADASNAVAEKSAIYRFPAPPKASPKHFKAGFDRLASIAREALDRAGNCANRAGGGVDALNAISIYENQIFLGIKKHPSGAASVFA